MANRPRSPLKPPPKWIRPQLALLVKEAPSGPKWLHEIKFDGYRLHARLDAGGIRLLTRSGLDWTHKYETTANAVSSLRTESAYIDGELCAVRDDGTTSFSGIQAASDNHQSAGLVYFAFDLLHLDGEDFSELPLLERKARLAKLLKKAPAAIRFSDHVLSGGPRFHQAACEHKAEGVVSKRVDAPYVPGDRGLWCKTKCLNREEFVIVGFTDPEGSRPCIGALLLGYYTDDGRLIYAGRGGGGISNAELRRLYAKLKPLIILTMPLAEKPPTSNRFGSPLELSRVHWVKPVLVCEVRFLTRTADGLLRQVTYEGLREDKPAREVRRPRPI